MEGRTFSHYRVLERLGGGGMGVVYKALDTRLDRPVALKFLPPELTRDEDARRRLILEAKAASALDHANICTVYDVDSTPEGQLFIVMSFYDGGTLKKRITQGRLSIEEALDVAIQIARGLAKAHEAGIVHRDVKPANVMITSDGVVKIVDFGIAKVVDQTGPTQTGVTLGTVAYMAPEQINGEVVDQRSDVWSLGAVLYEMLAGRTPFTGEHPLVLMKNIVNEPAAPLAKIRAEVPDDLVSVVNRALEKNRAARYESVAEFAGDLSNVRARLTAPAMPVAAPAWQVLRRPRVALVLLFLVISIGTLAGWSLNRSSKVRWAREQIPAIERLVEEDKYTQAFSLAEQIEPYLPGDSALEGLWPRFSQIVSVVTRPPGARTFTKDYGDPAEPWRDLGESPLQAVRVPLGLRRWRFTREGSEPVEIARPGTVVEVSLETGARGMVHVPGGDVRSWITGIEPITLVSVPDFLIDKYEVTNREFKTFVEAGGYRKREHWEHPFVDKGKTLSWEEAVARFVDATGRPGPATWELGEYRAGQDDYPVTGLSWYEAAAYAKYSGKSLPTVTHWIRAAGTNDAAEIAPLSNLQSAGLAPVGKYQGSGPFGTYDMAGNVREWCWNPWAGSRYILGAAWSDPAYMFTYANLQSPFDRSATNGIRLVKYAGGEGVPEAAAGPVELLARDYTHEKPASNATFEIYKAQLAYDATPLDPVVEQVESHSPDIRAEKVTFNAASGRDKAILYLFLPTTSAPPYQTVLHFPGSTAITTPSVVSIARLYEFVPKSGRVLAVPIYRGTFERRDGLLSTWPDESHRYVEYVEAWVQEARRAIDYLETRKDMDASRLAYFGVSWGARMGAIIPAVEPRIKTSILFSGGLASGRSRPEVDQLHYVSRVTTPVLMLNGQYDAIEPVETAQRPMFEMLGTPKDRKKWVVYDDGHGLAVRRNEVIKESLNWLDTYLGPVK